MSEGKEKLIVNYGERAAVLPCSVLDYLERASKLDLKILLGIAASAKCGAVDPDEVSVLLGITESQLRESVEFWGERNIIKVVDADSETEEKEETKDKDNGIKISGVTVKRSDEVPSYTSSELAVILERRSEATHFLNECQQLMGKMFNNHDINIILGLVDYMGLEWDYVTTLAEYCGRKGKRSAKYAEKLAISMTDKGIDNAEMLKEKLAEMDIIAENESHVRSLFGMKARAFTSKEKKFVEAWFVKFGFNADIVSRAYEITVNATGEASLPYTNAILERWNAEGLHTLEEINASIESKKKELKTESAGSFDTEDFFEAALKRSFDNKSK